MISVATKNCLELAILRVLRGKDDPAGWALTAVNHKTGAGVAKSTINQRVFSQNARQFTINLRVYSRFAIFNLKGSCCFTLR